MPAPPHRAHAKIGPVWYSGRAIQRVFRVKGAAIVAQILGYTRSECKDGWHRLTCARSSRGGLAGGACLAPFELFERLAGYLPLRQRFRPMLRQSDVGAP